MRCDSWVQYSSSFGGPQSRPWDRVLSARSLIGRWSQESHVNKRREKCQLHEHERASYFHGRLGSHPTGIHWGSLRNTLQNQENKNGRPFMSGLLSHGLRVAPRSVILRCTLPGGSCFQGGTLSGARESLGQRREMQGRWETYCVLRTCTCRETQVGQHEARHQQPILHLPCGKDIFFLTYSCMRFSDRPEVSMIQVGKNGSSGIHGVTKTDSFLWVVLARR